MGYEGERKAGAVYRDHVLRQTKLNPPKPPVESPVDPPPQGQLKCGAAVAVAANARKRVLVKCMTVKGE